MKLITQIDDDVLFLKKLYQSADMIKGFMDKTNLLDIRKKMPEFTGNETDAEKIVKIRSQAYANMMDMARVILEEHPEDVIELIHNFVILEDGEKFPHGVKMFSIITQVLTDPDILDFFTSLQLLGDKLSGN